MFFGQRVRELRKSKNLTQQKLADMINVTKVSICCYEKGTRTPNLETFIDLVEKLDTTPDYLLGRDINVVSEGEEPYYITIKNEEWEFISESRKNREISKRINENPKRFIQYINSRLQ